MRIPETVAALLTLWPDLPAKTGPDWPRLYWRLIDLLRRFAQATGDEERSYISLMLLSELRTLPDGIEVLRRVRKAELRITRSGHLYLGTAGDASPDDARPDDTTLREQMMHLLNPPVVRRATDVHAPTRVEINKRFPIIVGLTRVASDGETAQTVIQSRLNQLIRVVLTPEDGLELLTEPTKTLQVTEGDSEPVVFYLRAVRIGHQSVVIDFHAGSDLLTSITHRLVAAEDRSDATPHKLPARGLSIGAFRAPFPDLVLRVCTEGNRLTYTLHYHTTEERILKGPVLRADPEQYRYQIIREIENLARGLDGDGRPLFDTPHLLPTAQEMQRHLAKIGRRLYRDLFGEELAREYRERIRGRVRTLEIVSDEPWIPWELIKPYDDGVDDDFLCVQYTLSRWVSGGTAPAAEIIANTLACITPTDSGLAEAQVERDFVRGLAAQRGIADHSPAEARRSLVEQLLEGNTPIKLWHFACHGNFDQQVPDNSPLILQDQYFLRPNDLVGRAQTRLRTDRPLVFLNACRVGQGGLALTGLGGWAATLVGHCRVGALIAPLWSVHDGAARHFAEAFYTACQQSGMTLGEAIRHARIATRNAFPDDTTWLAYSLYAHPNARLVIGGE